MPVSRFGTAPSLSLPPLAIRPRGGVEHVTRHINPDEQLPSIERLGRDLDDYHAQCHLELPRVPRRLISDLLSHFTTSR